MDRVSVPWSLSDDEIIKALKYISRDGSHRFCSSSSVTKTKCQPCKPFPLKDVKFREIE